MAKRRKKWATGEGATRDEFTSQRQAYDFVGHVARSYAQGIGSDPTITVWVDEGGGRGWELYETVNLVEVAGMREAES